jgi:hypothetical protein
MSRVPGSNFWHAMVRATVRWPYDSDVTRKSPQFDVVGILKCNDGAIVPGLKSESGALYTIFVLIELL